MNPYVLLSSGTCLINDSVIAISCLPATIRVIQPTNVVNTTKSIATVIRYNGVRKCCRKASGNRKSVIHVNNHNRINTDAATGTTTIKPAKNDFRSAFNHSFMTAPS